MSTKVKSLDDVSKEMRGKFLDFVKKENERFPPIEIDKRIFTSEELATSINASREIVRKYIIARKFAMPERERMRGALAGRLVFHKSTIEHMIPSKSCYNKHCLGKSYKVI